ncbi:MAG: ABC transporter permease [Candidatus Aminicenantes bacterium]|nr:ABC transporter permease [Candidatus Aminicenantes bacterium]
MPTDLDAAPKLPLRLLTRFSPAEDRECLGGDFEEIYLALVSEQGRRAARRWIRGQCLRSLPRIAVHALAWRCTMLKNFLKVALRNLQRQWLTSAINIVGLAAGFAVVLLIVLFIRSELAFDAFHEKAPRIYRLNTRMVFDGRESRQAAVAPAVAPALQAACPEIEASARLLIERDPLTVGAAGYKFTEKRFFYTEPAFFDIFSFPLIEGDPRTALSEPHSLVLTQETARKYFPRENPLGKTLTVSGGGKSTDYIVRGVAADVPVESHFHFDFLAPFSDHELSRVDNWFLQAGRAYILLREGASVPALEAKFPPLIEVGAQANFGSVDTFRSWIKEGNAFEIFLQPLLDIRLHSEGLGAQIEAVGDIAQIWIFGAIALVILLIAVFNFVSLAAARSFQRALEVGVRKVMGSSRSLLVRQFLTESVLVSLFALALSALPVVLLVRSMTVLLGRPLSAADLLSWPVLPLVIAGALLTGLAAGAVPAFVLASFRPARVLRGRIDPFRRPRFRGFLVSTQFALSILLFIVTFVISGQIRYVRTKDLGFEKDRLLAVAMPPALSGRYAAFKAELERNPEIASVALSVYLPGRPMIGEDFTDARQDHGKMVNLALLAGDEDFQKTLGLSLAAGRFFNPEAGADGSAVVINEEAARGFRNVLGWDDPLGRTITNGRETMTIIGVLKDFHYHSLHRKIEPLAIQRLPAGRGSFIVLRTRGDDRAAAVDGLREAWKAFVPEQPFEYTSFSQETDSLYRSEKRTASLFSLFSGIAVILGCLGLFGLAAFSAERRIKEIGVRKVLGASRRGIVLMLLRQSGTAVLAANFVAWPAAFFFMRQWLRDFAYRMDLGPLPFLAAGALVFLLACLAAGGTAFRAASADPVKALKYE